MQDIASVIEKIDEVEKSIEHIAVTSRMDDDYAIWTSNLQSKAFAQSFDDHPEVINIPSSDARAFADEIHDLLVRSERVINIYTAEQKGSDERENISDLERLFDFTFERGDILLQDKGLPPLKDSLAWYAGQRGRSAVRIMNYLNKKKELVADYMPLDPRWLTYGYGKDQMQWAAYKTFRSATELKKTYKYVASKKEVEVQDYWELEEKTASNALICEGAFLEPPVSYSVLSLPIVHIPVSTRPMVTDSIGIRSAGYGDSWYAASRNLVPIINELLTMWATWGNILAHAPIIQTVGEGSKQLEEIKSRMGALITLPKGDEIHTMDLKEISATLVNLVQLLLEMWQRATKPFISFGQTSQDLSGTAIDMLKSGEEKAYGPILRNMDAMFTAICYKTEEQINSGKLRFDVKGVDKEKELYKRKITPVTVNRPHVIKVEHIVKSRYGQLSQLQKAQMEKQLGFSTETVLERLKVRDPKREIELAAQEMLDAHPAVKAAKAMGRAVLEERWDDARFYKLLGDVALQSLVGQATPPTEISGTTPEQGAIAPQEPPMTASPEAMPMERGV